MKLNCLNSEKNLLIFIFLPFFIVSCAKEPEIKGIFVDFQKVDRVKKEVRKKNPAWLPAYNRLLEAAAMALSEEPASVMDKKRIPPSGDKHDYLSLGTYWWPDSSKADGLPYIRKDGLVNPETSGEYVDAGAKSSFFSNVETLTWAYFFTGNRDYASRAMDWLDTWFVNPETRMNPNLNFAQGIPGICDGRGIGIIDWSRIDMLITPIQILDAYGMLKPETKTAVYSWFEVYLNWLLTSEFGKYEDNYFNNHGTWFDVQATGIALLLGKTDIAKERLEKITKKRIQSQIEPDGSMPHELARTRSLSYSTMNLLGFSYLANLGQFTGVDLWNFETPDGRGIKKAHHYLLPFAAGEKQWTHPQITDPEGSVRNLGINFVVAESRTGDSFYRQVTEKSDTSRTDLKILLFPVFK